MIGWIAVALAGGLAGTWIGYRLGGSRARRASSAVIEQTRAELARRLSELFSLQELSYLLSESLKADHIVGQVAGYVHRFLRADGAMVVLTGEPAGTGPVVAAAQGCLAHLAGATLEPGRSELIDTVIGRERVEVLESEEGEPIPELAGVPVQRAAAAPLRAHGATAGAVVVALRGGTAFTAEDLRLLSTVATHAATVLANARLFDLVRVGKEQWESTFDALTEGIAVVDHAGQIRRANRGLANLTGRPLSALIGDDLEAALLGQPGVLREPLAAARDGNQPAPVTRRSATSDRTLRIVLAPIRGERAHGWVVALIADVTEQTALETQLIQSEKMAAVGQLVSGVAHELNNPLTSIAGLSEFLLEQRTAGDRDRDHLTVIHEQAERAGRIVRNLLTFARSGTSDVTDVDLNDVAQRTVSLVGYELRLRDIQLEVELAPDLPAVRGDRFELQQVVVNLLTNAVQAVGENPPGRPRAVKIRTARVGGGDQVTLTVADSGPGISEETLPHIFTPFYTTKDPGRGTGLGLSISFGIVERHGGRLVAERETGAGARFVMTLPTGSEPRRSGATARPTPGSIQAPLEPVGAEPAPVSRILVVDDDPAVRRMIRVVFADRGQSVEDARDAAQAIDLLSRGTYDLVIADPRAAVSAGETFAEVSLARWPDLRHHMILVTADVRRETDDWLRGLGCRYFRKPFKINELRNAAEQAVRR